MLNFYDGQRKLNFYAYTGYVDHKTFLPSIKLAFPPLLYTKERKFLHTKFVSHNIITIYVFLFAYKILLINIGRDTRRWKFTRQE